MPREPIPTWAFSVVLVRLGRRVLLVHERKHGQGWYLPAGRVEAGESFQAAALRETREEAGIDIVLEGVLRVEYSARPHHARVRVIFVARPADDRPPKGEPDEESLGARWFTVEEMSGVELRADEARALARMVLDGAHIHPLSVLADG